MKYEVSAEVMGSVLKLLNEMPAKLVLPTLNKLNAELAPQVKKEEKLKEEEKVEEKKK